jgi:hypothetical protein
MAEANLKSQTAPTVPPAEPVSATAPESAKPAAVPGKQPDTSGSPSDTGTGTSPAPKAASGGATEFRKKFTAVDSQLKARREADFKDIATEAPEWLSAAELVFPVPAPDSGSAQPPRNSTQPETAPEATSAPIVWPTDALARACLFAAAFFERLTYSELLRLVEFLVPPPAPEAPKSNAGELVAPPPAPSRSPLDLMPCLAEAGLRRQPAPDGRQVIGFTAEGRDRQVRRWLLEEQYGYVFVGTERLLAADTALAASARIRLPLARLVASLMEQDDAYAAETLRRVLVASSQLGGKSPELTPAALLGAAVDFLRQTWEIPRLREGVLKELGTLSGRQHIGTLVGLLGLSSFIPAAERSQLLRRAATGGQPEERRMIARDLWWRIMTNQEGAREFLQGLVEWAREIGPDGKVTEFGGWSLRHLRRMVVMSVVEGAAQPTLYGLLTEQGTQDTAAPASVFGMLAQLLPAGEVAPAQKYALAALFDACADESAYYPGTLPLPVGLASKPVVAWLVQVLADPPAALGGQSPASPQQWAWTEVLGCRSVTPELAALVLPTELFWRLGLSGEAVAQAAAERFGQSLRRSPAAFQRSLRTFLSQAAPEFQSHFQMLSSLKEQATEREERARWSRVRTFVQAKAQAITQLRRALG